MRTGHIQSSTSHAPPQPSQLNYVYGTHAPMLPHSKSFDHYVDPSTSFAQSSHHNRHSFDQPYDTNASTHYDMVDGSTGYPQCNHAAAAYNVSGNRYPIPPNVSNQFSAGQYSTIIPPCNGAAATGSVYHQIPTTIISATQQWHHKPPATIDPIPNEYNGAGADQFYYNCGNNYNKKMDERMYEEPIKNSKNTNRTDHLIDLVDDRGQQTVAATNIMPPPFPYGSNHTNQLLDNDLYENRNVMPHNYRKSSISTDTSKLHSRHNKPESYAQTVRTPAIASTSNHYHRDQLSNDLYNLNINTEKDLDSNYHEDGGGSSSNNKHSKATIDKYSRNAKLLADYEDPMTNGSRNSRASDFDSYDDPNYSNAENRVSSQTSKNHDGVGSYETWNFVYKKLEKQGYNKDLGERVDLSVQGLDLNPTEKKSSSRTQHPQQHDYQKKNSVPSDAVVPVTVQSSSKTKPLSDKHEHSKENGRVKSESTDTKVNGNKFVTKKSSDAMSTTNGNVKYSKNDVDKLKSITSNGGSGTMKRSKETSSTSRKETKPTIHRSEATVIVAAAAPTEWSCKFCTFLNPNSIRICSMCAKSKDFIDVTTAATSSTTPTAKATTTCV